MTMINYEKLLSVGEAYDGYRKLESTLTKEEARIWNDAASRLCLLPSKRTGPMLKKWSKDEAISNNPST